MQRLILLVITFLFIAGCGSHKSTFVLLPDANGKVGKIIVNNSQGTQTLSQAGQSVVIKKKTESPGEIRMMDEAEIHTLFSKALDIQPLPPAKFLLYFRTESAKPNPESESKIAMIIQAIKDRNSMDISVNGYTDLTGEADYNYDLSFKRARQVKNMLEQQGIDPATITTTSHGMNNPLVPTAYNVPEPRNRRVEVIVR